MIIHVQNKKNICNKISNLPSSSFYIGRPSVLGNPFIIGRDGTRKEVIDKYKKWLKEKIRKKDKDIMTELQRIKNEYKKGDIYLVCWCSPLPCHGDIIKEVLERI